MGFEKDFKKVVVGDDGVVKGNLYTFGVLADAVTDIVIVRVVGCSASVT